MHGGSDGPLATSAEWQTDAAQGGAAGYSTKPIRPMNEIATNRSTNFFHSTRLRAVQHAGHHVRSEEEGDVDQADDGFPPRRVRLLQVRLQPHGGFVAEEQCLVHVDLQMPLGRPADQQRRAPAVVVEQQHQCERQPIAQHQQRVPPPDAGCHQAGTDAQQQHVAVVGDAFVDHPVRDGQRPDGQGGPAQDGELTSRQPVSACRRLGCGLGTGSGIRARQVRCPFWPDQPLVPIGWDGLS